MRELPEKRRGTKPLAKKKTLIDRLFYEIAKREMTPQERRILLPQRKKTRKRR